MNKYPFDQVIADSTSKFHKIKKEDYLPIGQYKIVDQGKEFIAGYTNDKELVNTLSSPIVIFGDHTKIFKYVDFPLALGADGAKALTINKNLADSKYIYYYFRTLKLTNAGYSRHFKFLKEVSIPLPENYDDQIRIATVLTRVEKLIVKRKESINALDELLKSTFLEMFGDPMRNEKGWERKALVQLGSLDRGVSKHRPRNAPELLGGKYPLIQTGEVSNSGTYITQYTQTYSESGFKQSKLWKAGTLCITIAANIAKTGILTFDACFPDSVVGFIADKNETHVLYIHNLFGFFQMILEKNAPQAAQKNINLDILRNLQVPKPSLPLQKQFAAFVEKVEMLKEKYTLSLTELENLYGSLSQRAFKGELDLSRVPIVHEITATEEIKIKIGADVELKTKLKFTAEDLVELIMKKYPGKLFSFDELWKEIETQTNKKNPSRNDIQAQLIELLESDKANIQQIFDVLTSQTDKNAAEKQIAFRGSYEN